MKSRKEDQQAISHHLRNKWEEVKQVFSSNGRQLGDGDLEALCEPDKWQYLNELMDEADNYSSASYEHCNQVYDLIFVSVDRIHGKITEVEYEID